jgi:hypothetical protein
MEGGGHAPVFHHAHVCMSYAQESACVCTGKCPMHAAPYTAVRGIHAIRWVAKVASSSKQAHSVRMQLCTCAWENCGSLGACARHTARDGVQITGTHSGTCRSVGTCVWHTACNRVVVEICVGI